MAKTIEEIAGLLFADETERASFVKKVGDSGLKIADLSDGDFVTKQKYQDHLDKYAKLQKQLENPEDNEAYKSALRERDELKSKVDSLSGEILKNSYIGKVRGAKVDDKFTEFVVDKVSKQVSDTMTFDDALKKYVADNPQFCEEPMPSALPLQNPQGGKDANSILNNIIRTKLNG